MGILSDLFHKIFPSSHPASTASDATLASATGTATAAAPTTPPVDIEAVLSAMQAKNNQPLNWRTSIVDLMKLVGMDSSLANRKQLAEELHYTGDTNDSASMNIWLHKQVMQRMAANGGKVPADLLD